MLGLSRVEAAEKQLPTEQVNLGDIMREVLEILTATAAKKNIGIESVPEAIKSAVENSKLNKINNSEFILGEIKNILNKCIKKLNKFHKQGPKIDSKNIIRPHQVKGTPTQNLTSINREYHCLNFRFKIEFL